MTKGAMHPHLNQILAALVCVSILLPAPAAPEGDVSYELADGRKVSPLERFRECDACTEMIVMPPGAFMMGAKRGEPTTPRLGPRSEEYFSIKTTLCLEERPSMPRVTREREEISNRQIKSVGDCLMHGEDLKNARIDWSKTRTLSDLEDCAFLAGEELRDAYALGRWLEVNGFLVDPPAVVRESVMLSYGTQGRGTRISGTIRKEKIPLALGFIDRFFVHSLSIGIILNNEARPILVRAAFTRT